jgi:hypothetical protein
MLVKNGTLSIGPIPKDAPVGLLTNMDLLAADLPASEQLRQLEKLPKLLGLVKRELARGNNVFANKEIVDAMLELSKCPDLVVNKGHYFGTNLMTEEPGLNDTEKRDLIGFIKTF